MMEKMQNAMMKRYQLFAWMGLIIVLIAFLASLAAANANAISPSAIIVSWIEYSPAFFPLIISGNSRAQGSPRLKPLL